MSKKVGISMPSIGLLILLFIIMVLPCCHHADSGKSPAISLSWKNGKAVALYLPKKNVSAVSEDSLTGALSVQLADHGDQPSVLGETSLHEDTLFFTPMIPFTKGLRYKIFIQKKFFAEIGIPRSIEIPGLSAVYPTSDTVPENLLKIYLVFSRPMKETDPLKYVNLTNAKGDSLPNSFLNLQNSLWNEEGTILSLWLDPGRIKRDLQPHQSLGAPLTKGEHYTLSVSGDWPDKDGNLLGKVFTKKLFVFSRDSISPDMNTWKLNLPPKETTDPLIVNTGEPMDFQLLRNCITISDNAGNLQTGTIQIGKNESSFIFTPDKAWKPGKYTLQVEARLEDLAGNNLNRLFDVDLKSKEKNHPQKTVYEKLFTID